MKTFRSLLPCLINIYFYRFIRADGDGILNTKYHFPAGSNMGIFLAVALPLKYPNKNIYMSYNFEANYPLPYNKTLYNYPPLVGRDNHNGTGMIDRKLLYDLLESKLEKNGYSGRSCILKTICEASAIPVLNNGLLGDLLHILLTPSFSENDKDFPVDYHRAEIDGNRLQDCSRYHGNCTGSFLDVISLVL